MVDWNSIAQMFGYKDERSMYIDLYHNQHMSLSDIADRLDSGRATIRRRMQVCEVSRRGQGGPNNPSHKRALLHLLDQRFVRSAPITAIAHTIDAHISTVWKYLRES
jgi:transposase